MTSMSRKADGRMFGGGLQDNGTNVTLVGKIMTDLGKAVTLSGKPDDFIEISGGDGGWMIIDPQNSEHFYTTSQNMSVSRFRKSDGWADVSPPAHRNETDAVWMAFLEFDPDDSRTVFAGGLRVWRTKDDGNNWQDVSPVLDGSAISAVEIAQANTKMLYVGTEKGGIYRSTDGGNTWSEDLASPVLPGFTVTRILTGPTNAQIVYVTVANFHASHVFRSKDGGATWTDIDRGRLPDVPHYAVAIPNAKPSTVYVCSDAGVHVSTDAGETWKSLTRNLPTVPIVDLVYHETDGTLTATIDEESGVMTRSRGTRFDKRLSIVVAAAIIASGAVSAQAADPYPNRPIRLIVPFAAGGLNDVVARLVGPYLERALGQPVIVDNRPAASGIVGTDAVAKAPPDGHALLMVASSHAVVPATKPKLPYDAERDLAPIVMVAKNSLLFLVHPKIEAKSLAEFIALAKADPGKFNYASPGAASQAHLVVELLSQKAGIKLQHIPYRGGAPAIQAMVAGDTHFTVISTLASLPHMRSGAVRAIATGGLTREAQFPDLPTVAEQGFPGFEAIQWIGLLTTAGTPRDVVERINAEVNRALRDPDLVGKLAVQGLAAAGGTSAEFQRTISNDIKTWTEIARAANIKAE